MKKINYVWRLIATGISFILFGIGALCLSVIIFPVIRITARSQERKKKLIKKTLMYTFRSFMYFMHYTRVLKFETENIETLVNDRSCLVVANHPTLIDVVSVIAFSPNACCIVKESLWNNFFVSGVLKTVGYIPNNDPVKILEKCKESIDNGDVLIIFPEGTRTKPGQKAVFQRGAAHIALETGCLVRCVEITCVPSTLEKGNPWYQIPSRRANFKLAVRGMVNPRTSIKEGTPRPLAARQITREFLNEYCSSV